MVQIEFMPVDYDYFDWQGRNYALVIGRTKEGKRALVIDSFLPYFWAVLKDGVSEKKIKEIREKIEKIKTNGNNWLEPLEHFIMSAFQAQKIAAEKNELQNLSNFARSACSNFFLTDQHLQFSYNLGFNSLKNICGSPHPATYFADLSLCVICYEQIRTEFVRVSSLTASRFA